MLSVSRKKRFAIKPRPNHLIGFLDNEVENDRTLPLRRQLRHPGTNLLPVGTFGHLKIVLRLEAHPDAGGRAEIAGEAHRSVCRDSTLAPYDLADPQGRHPDVGGDAVLAQAEWGHEILQQNFSGMDWVK